MHFKATDDQVKQIVVNAINASQPVGLGSLHFEDVNYHPADIALRDDGISVDYFRGRMVKLSIKRVGQNEWHIYQPRGDVKPDYQSWARKYPSARALVASVVEQP